MSSDDEEPRRKIHLVHVPEDYAFVSEVADALKELGVEISGRTFYERSYTPGPGEIARLEERARHYLRQIDTADPIPMELRFFLSYANEDLHDVRRFDRELARRGIPTWRDEKNLHAGGNWVEEMFEALTSCCGFIAFFSRYSLVSHIADLERRFFLERQKLRTGTFLGLVLLHEMDVDLSLKENAVIIDLYRMPASDAVEKLQTEIVTFYRRYLRVIEELQDHDES